MKNIGLVRLRDVVIIGGSFAGLSTAYFIDSGSTLILEKEKSLGIKQRSACATFVESLKRLKCEKSILRTFDTLTFHSPDFEAKVTLFTPLCTFDYKMFCELLKSKLSNAEIITGSKVSKVFNGNPKRVLCKDKEYKGKILVDCSGWGATIAKNLSSNYGYGSKLAYGVETESNYEGDNNSIHFFFGKKFIKGGYGWIFPIGEERARIGVGSFNNFKGREGLKKFMASLNMGENKLDIHGGFIPCFGLRDPVIKDIFVVGDACGQVLPVSAEGIRKAIYYGEICGTLVSKVLKGELELAEALNLYRNEVHKSKVFYDNLSFLQKIAVYVPDLAWNKIAKKIPNAQDIAQKLLKIYLEDNLTASKFTMLRKLARAMVT